MQKIFKQVVWFIIPIPVIYLAFVWKRLPDRIAMHFDIHGNADQYNNKDQFLVFMAIMLVISGGIYLLLTNIYRIDPKKYAAENKDRLQKIAITVVTFLCAIQCLVIFMALQGSMKLNVRFFFALMGLFWAVIGNYMNNIKPNYFAGFRLPWTLESEENWRYTHHLASKLWFTGGLLIALICSLTTTTIAIIALFTISSVVTIIPIIYSYRFYKRQKSNTTK